MPITPGEVASAQMGDYYRFEREVRATLKAQADTIADLTRRVAELEGTTR